MAEAAEAAHKAHEEVLAIRRMEAERLKAVIRHAADVLHASYAKPGRQVASAAAEARRVLEEAVGKEKGS